MAFSLFLFEVMRVLFDRLFASAVVNSTLACNIFEVPFVKRKHSSVSFVCGQLLGYHAFWPLFALSNRIFIWWCAEQVYPGETFSKYSVLGDDVVIADQKVVRVYETALLELGVRISYQKSLISSSGCVEFAKRFRIRGVRKDVSPISIRNLVSSHHPFGLVAVQDKYPCKRVFYPMPGRWRWF